MSAQIAAQTPITLRTLRQASLQEIFDQAAQHLLTQGARSMAPHPANGEMQCAYRGENGRKCAVGVFIADDEYTPRDEGSIAELVCGGLTTRECLRLLQDLQTLHDSCEPADWRHELAKLAAHGKLSPAVLGVQP